VANKNAFTAMSLCRMNGERERRKIKDKNVKLNTDNF
jgi:hypothetical protein